MGNAEYMGVLIYTYKELAPTNTHKRKSSKRSSQQKQQAKQIKMAPVTVTYAIPVKGDKVVRSPKYGQTTLRGMPGIKRIFVDDRSNSFFNKNGTELVKVVITARSKSSADAC